MLAGIQESGNVSRQISSLQELNMVLSMGSGNIRVGEVAPILVKLLNSSQNLELVRIEVMQYKKEREKNTILLQLRAWIASFVKVLLSCRALNTIIDINPRACDLILPAVATLCERLLKPDDIDVTEQCMKW